MKINLDGKTPAYIGVVSALVKAYKKNPTDAGKLKLSFFMQHADGNGAITDPQIIYKLLDRANLVRGNKLFVTIDLYVRKAYVLLNSDPDHSKPQRLLKNDISDRVEIKVFPKHKIEDNLENFKNFLWIHRYPWYHSLNQIKAIWLQKDQLILRAFDGGFSFEALPEDLWERYHVGMTKDIPESSV